MYRLRGTERASLVVRWRTLVRSGTLSALGELLFSAEIADILGSKITLGNELVVPGTFDITDEKI